MTSSLDFASKVAGLLARDSDTAQLLDDIAVALNSEVAFHQGCFAVRGLEAQDSRGHRSRMIIQALPEDMQDWAFTTRIFSVGEARPAAIERIAGCGSVLLGPLRSGGICFGLCVLCGEPVFDLSDVDRYVQIEDAVSLFADTLRSRELLAREESARVTVRLALHDLKSCLGIIRGYIEGVQDLEDFKGLAIARQNVFAVLARNTKYLVELVSELSEILQIGSVGFRLRECRVPLTEFLEEISEVARMIAERKGMRLRIETEGDVHVTASFDPVKIRRVLENLLVNAVKYSPRGQLIQLRVARQPERLIFAIVDQGVGIPEAEQGQLFREYGRTSAQPTEGEPSTGLGLAIVRRIVELHGGEISLSSRLGQGSTFTVWLPLSGTRP